ncbi:MAG: IclR family transcriptional regulator [Rhodospirillales bacterium]|jgi:IclR family acetate operon transcriptional repressor
MNETADSSSNSSGRTIQSVARALDILEVLSRAEGEMQLGEIALATDLNVSTCHHILLTLMNRGYAAQNKRGRAYFLGAKILELSSNRARQFSLAELAMPELRELNAATGENVHLAVIQGNDLVALARLDSSKVVQVNMEAINLSNAAHATAIGKSILAWLPENEIERIVDQKGLAQFTSSTITEFEALNESLRLVRRFGFAIDREEFLPGVVSIGTALRDYSGTVLGSVSCTLPASRADDENVENVKQAVLACVAELSGKFGRPEGDSP